MSTNGDDNTSAASMLEQNGPTPQCGPGTHWDDVSKTCVPDEGGEILASTTESAPPSEEK